MGSFLLTWMLMMIFYVGFVLTFVFFGVLPMSDESNMLSLKHLLLWLDGAWLSGWYALRRFKSLRPRQYKPLKLKVVATGAIYGPNCGFIS